MVLVTRSDCIITNVAMQGIKGLKLARLLKSRVGKVPAGHDHRPAPQEPRTTGDVPRRAPPSPQPIGSNALISPLKESLAS
jgi:hypothetical protein